jgi:hypothetical protein
MKNKGLIVQKKKLKKIISNCCFYLPRYGTLHKINATEDDYFLCTNEHTLTEERVWFEDIDLANDKFYKMTEADLKIERI